jgi:hypothetical protein
MTHADTQQADMFGQMAFRGFISSAHQNGVIILTEWKDLQPATRASWIMSASWVLRATAIVMRRESAPC